MNRVNYDLISFVHFSAFHVLNINFASSGLAGRELDFKNVSDEVQYSSTAAEAEWRTA